MSKYYKAEDVINTLADQWRFEQEMEYSDTAEDIEEWRKVARELFADLPTIEVSEDNKAYTYCSRCGMRVVVDEPSVVPQVPSEDCISKSWLKNELDKWSLEEGRKDAWDTWNKAIETLLEIIDDAPSVVPTTEQSCETCKHQELFDCRDCKFASSRFASKWERIEE